MLEAVGIATSCLGAEPWILSFVVEAPSLSKMSSTVSATDSSGSSLR